MAVRLGQYKAHYWTWSNSWEELKKVRSIDVSLLICAVTPSLLFLPSNLSQTHKSCHCWCYHEKRGSSADCWVYRSVMNINEEPPRQQTCIIHQPVRLFVQTPAEIFFLLIYISLLFNHKERKMESANIS